MSRIFNSIRQRLLAQNRFTRYILYAIGEIVLVVIGILIALHCPHRPCRRTPKWSKGRAFAQIQKLT
jgi:hypothetical protein